MSLLSIHELSRPCVCTELMGEAVRAAKRYESGAAAARVEYVIRKVGRGADHREIPGKGQARGHAAPQTFNRDLLVRGLEAARRKKMSPCGEREALHVVKEPVCLVYSNSSTVKIRSSDELVVVVGALMKGK